MFFNKCKYCTKLVQYKTEKGKEKASRDNTSICTTCRQNAPVYSTCTVCKIEISYRNYSSFSNAKMKNTLQCSKCKVVKLSSKEEKQNLVNLVFTDFTENLISMQDLTEKYKISIKTVFNYIKLGYSSIGVDFLKLNSYRCSRCNLTKDTSNYQYGRVSSRCGYRYLYCNDCRNTRTKVLKYSSIESYIKNRVGELRRRSRNLNIEFNLDFDFVMDLYRLQGGKCFYTDVNLIVQKDCGIQKNHLSFDRVTFDKGYIKGNVVLCSYRANSIKSDCSMDELKLWMPGWYERLNNCSYIYIYNV